MGLRDGAAPPNRWRHQVASHRHIRLVPRKEGRAATSAPEAECNSLPWSLSGAMGFAIPLSTEFRSSGPGPAHGDAGVMLRPAGTALSGASSGRAAFVRVKFAIPRGLRPRGVHKHPLAGGLNSARFVAG